MNQRTLCYAALTFSLTLSALAQDAHSGGAADDPSLQPAEDGIRFTPGIARALARQFTKEVMVGQYELDRSKLDQASELIARHMMQMAHENEQQAQEAVEFLAAAGLEMSTKPGNFQGFTREFGMEVGKRIVPMMPSVHKLIDGVVDDVRPMLGFKGQLKMTGQVTAAKVALGYFQEAMERWSKGGARPFENPFDAGEEEKARADGVKREQNGQSKALNRAERMAQNMSKRAPGDEWDPYLDEATKYYGFDASQVAAAESLIRDYRARARVAVGGVEAWGTRLREVGYWLGIAIWLPCDGGDAITTLLYGDMAEVREPLKDLGDELRQKIDEVATQAQRNAAERRVMEALAAKGFDFGDQQAAGAVTAGGEETSIDSTAQK